MLDWPFIAALATAAGGIIGLVIQWFKRERPWKKIQDKLIVRTTINEEKIKALTIRIDSINERINDEIHRSEKDIERLDGQIEQLTALMIKMLTTNKE